MRDFADIERQIRDLGHADDAASAASTLLALGEEILERWLVAHDQSPRDDRHEGFRLLALHRQAARGEPSFNACRESCRELVYRHNLIALDPDHPDIGRRLRLMSMVALHLCLFIAGKLEEKQLGEFCCSSRPLRARG